MCADSDHKIEGLPKSPKFLEARESLPEELRPVYDEIVTDYSWCTIKRYGRGYVAYAVLAEMVSMGWRPTPTST